MKFFTDNTIENPYLLIKLRDYLHKRPFPNKKEVFIDPGVYELRESKHYSWEGGLPIRSFLDSLPQNHYFSFDYPPDMNQKHTPYFLKRSWENAKKYHTHPQYIVTVQSKFRDYRSFKRNFDKYNELEIKSGILGLGNFCRIHYLTEFVRHALSYAFSRCEHERIHIYGLALRSIPFAYELARENNIELSIDSMNWTRPVRDEMKDKYGGISCKGEHREDYFEEYKKVLEERGIPIN